MASQETGLPPVKAYNKDGVDGVPDLGHGENSVYGRVSRGYFFENTNFQNYKTPGDYCLNKDQ
jgi:hypothetical protein